jgi:hypothetical protein
MAFEHTAEQHLRMADRLWRHAKIPNYELKDWAERLAKQHEIIAVIIARRNPIESPPIAAD